MSEKKNDANASEDYEERREHERYETSYAVDYASGDTFLFSYLTNISEMGIFIRSENPLEVGSILRLRFHIENQEPLIIEGEVIWVNPFHESGENLNPGMGVRFRHLTAELREQVVELVRTIAYLGDNENSGN
ncbi:MAG: PilZ domain-containing protein [Deltaproteobacteria bacterium]|nr:PilZ domain-containing protein [Deltaproteobacteria bacterium]